MTAWGATAAVWLVVALALGLPALETVAGVAAALLFGSVASLLPPRSPRGEPPVDQQAGDWTLLDD